MFLKIIVEIFASHEMIETRYIVFIKFVAIGSSIAFITLSRYFLIMSCYLYYMRRPGCSLYVNAS